jgi:hypothetical protein
MNLSAFINGDIGKIAEEEVANIQKSGRAAVTAGGQKSQDVLRKQVQSAGLGPGVEKAWRLTIYPKGSRRADNPAAQVKSGAPRIIAAFDAGVTITANKAQWLLIPLQGAIDLGLDKIAQRPGSRAGNTAKWSNIKAAIERFGDVRFVPLKGGRALVVAEARVGKTVKGERFYRVKANSRRTASVVLFLAVRRVKLPKLLDVDAGAKSGIEEMYATYVAALNRD